MPESYDLLLKGGTIVNQDGIGTRDLAIKAGQIAFAMDQQPYLQGFLSIQTAYQYLNYGLHPIGLVTTGPLVIDASNVERTLEVNKTHSGVRGAS